MNNRIDTCSCFRGLVIPVLSALTFSADGSTRLDICDMDYLPTITPTVQVRFETKSYTEYLDSRSSNTVEITSDMMDLLTVKSFAEKYINNLTPIQESIQAVIDDYFWDML